MELRSPTHRDADEKRVSNEERRRRRDLAWLAVSSIAAEVFDTLQNIVPAMPDEGWAVTGFFVGLPASWIATKAYWHRRRREK
jgi:hypothetical protein